MFGRRRKRGRLSRDVVLGGVPARAPVVRQEEKDNKLYVTVEFVRPRWQTVLGADRRCERTYGLDPYGRKVYELCNGKRTVKKIVRRFADDTRLSLAEAEMAVTKFMKTLIVKGLVAVAVDGK